MNTLRSRMAILLVAGLTLGACATPAEKTAMVPGEIKIVSASNPYRANVSDVDTYGGQETNPMLMSQISAEDFQASLEDALKKAGIFSPSGRYTVRADILGLEQPMFGVSLKVTMTVRYNVIDASGKIRMDRTIESEYTAAFSEAVLGVERLRKANEGAARENIARFLRVLGSEERGGNVAVRS